MRKFGKLLWQISACCLALCLLHGRTAGAQADSPGWQSAAARKPFMTAEETRVFMKRLASFVCENHMKKDPSSPQLGMIYEYFWVSKKGTQQQWIQGEALDTMHDGAWFAAAMVNASRATGDPFYRDILVKWQLPFYLKMLTHSDELFTSERNDGRPGDDRGWRTSKEWLLQGKERGFVPYWWDDGASVSLDMLNRRDNDEHVNFAGRNELDGKPNPEKKLHGYSHGCSNHMAQDLAVMLQQAWLLLHDSTDAVERKLAAETAEASRNLQECRERHGSGNIPMVKAALAVTMDNAGLRAALPDYTWKTVSTGRSDYRRALFTFKPGEKMTLPGFADDQQYRYYIAIARNGRLPEPAAFWLVYDAFTLPMLYRLYCDDIPAPPGINVFDLHPYTFIDGKPADYRSECKGPFKRPRPVGSRFGPQNMVVSGLALQTLKTYPGLWDLAKQQITVTNFFPSASVDDVRTSLEKELGGGLRTWEAVFDHYGYIPTCIGGGSVVPGATWDELSDTGGYAHLVSACAQWLFYLEGRNDWDEQHLPPLEK